MTTPRQPRKTPTFSREFDMHRTANATPA
jgi:hypothetical protein